MSYVIRTSGFGTTIRPGFNLNQRCGAKSRAFCLFVACKLQWLAAFGVCLLSFLLIFGPWSAWAFNVKSCCDALRYMPKCFMSLSIPSKCGFRLKGWWELANHYLCNSQNVLGLLVSAWRLMLRKSGFRLLRRCFQLEVFLLSRRSGICFWCTRQIHRGLFGGCIKTLYI